MDPETAKAIADSREVFFYRNVTSVLLQHQEIFAPMYANEGRPATNPALILAAEIYAKYSLTHDRDLISKLKTDSDFRRALGLQDHGTSSSICPWCRTTLYAFRARARKYLEKTGIDIYAEGVRILTEDYQKQMGITMDNLRSDSTLIEANIKPESRSELLFEAIRLVCRDLVQNYSTEVLTSCGLDVDFLQSYYKNKTFRNRLIYYHDMTPEETCQFHIDTLVKLCDIFEAPENQEYHFRERTSVKLMLKVFQQKCVVQRDENGNKFLRMATSEDNFMKPSDIQSLFDLDCAFREKNHVVVRGYVFNTIEALEQGRSLIVGWQTYPAVKADIEMLREYVEMLPDYCPAVQGEVTRRIIVDGAYYSEEMAQLCLKKGYVLFPTDLMGNKPDTFLAGFKVAPDKLSIECPEGHTSLDCLKPDSNGNRTYHMDVATCASCPHREECVVTGKRVASVKLSETKIHRARVLAAYGEDEGKACRNLRSGVEGIQSTVKNRYHRARMLYKSLVKNRMDMSCVVAGMNFTKLWEFRHGTGNYTPSPLLAS